MTKKFPSLTILITASLFPISAIADTTDVTSFKVVEVKGTRQDYKTNTVSTATKMDVTPLETPRSINSFWMTCKQHLLRKR